MVVGKGLVRECETPCGQLFELSRFAGIATLALCQEGEPPHRNICVQWTSMGSDHHGISELARDIFTWRCNALPFESQQSEPPRASSSTAELSVMTVSE